MKGFKQKHGSLAVAKRAYSLSFTPQVPTYTIIKPFYVVINEKFRFGGSSYLLVGNILQRIDKKYFTYLNIKGEKLSGPLLTNRQITEGIKKRFIKKIK